MRRARRSPRAQTAFCKSLAPPCTRRLASDDLATVTTRPTSPAQHGEDVACRVHEPIALTSQERGEGRMRAEAAARRSSPYADLTAIPGYATTSPDASYSSWDVNSAARAA